MSRIKEGPTYKIFSSFDTETCNVGSGDQWSAYPVAYMFGDLYHLNISEYKAGSEVFHVYRREEEALDHIEELIAIGREHGVVPVVVVYNMMFDLQSLIWELNARYDISSICQSSTNAYTLDLQTEGVTLLRFWDCFHFDMRGLGAMGEVCGLEKLKGDWDYSLLRTPETPITDEEMGYIRRDVQVVPAYLRYILESNPWVSESDLGFRVLTKTGLVRKMAQREIGSAHVLTKRGRKVSLLSLFENLCRWEWPCDYRSYAMRKACFRGGYTFTCAATASVPQAHVCSLDVTSMHHTFINGRKVPVKFKACSPWFLGQCMDAVLSTSLQQVLKSYHQPFSCAFHGAFLITNLRLKKGSAFERWDVGLIPKAKFQAASLDDVGNIRNALADNGVREHGYKDRVKNPTFAFSKLMEADCALVHLNEIELWCVGQVYEWDSIEAVEGEATCNFTDPPDYVTLQSMRLYQAKDQMKKLLSAYEEGKFNPGLEVPEMLGPMASEIRQGNVSYDFLNSYYTTTIKGLFNGIYGVQAQDLLRPDYMCRDGELMPDLSTVVTPDNYADKTPKKPKVLYTYGMRIVGGSRQHLVIAMMLVHDALGSRADVTGGDTDSLKVRCDEDVAPHDLLQALEPLHRAATDAIAACTARAKKVAPQWASDLRHVGCFEVEGSDPWYTCHMELWNKCRVSWQGDVAHVTCAGLSRPHGSYTMEDALHDAARAMGPAKASELIMGYNVVADNSVCHALQHKKPRPWERFEGDVTDYQGETAHVSCHGAIALYPCDRVLGETVKAVNWESLERLRARHHRIVDDSVRVVSERGVEVI